MKVEKPSVADLLHAARLLKVDLLWDPDRYPAGPQEEDRHILAAAVALQAENIRASEVRPERIPEMVATYARAFNSEPGAMVTHLVTVVDFMAHVLATLGSAEKSLEDATVLLRVGLSILATSLAEIPYQRVDMAALSAPRNLPGCACGGAGSREGH